MVNKDTEVEIGTTRAPLGRLMVELLDVVDVNGAFEVMSVAIPWVSMPALAPVCVGVTDGELVGGDGDGDADDGMAALPWKLVPVLVAVYIGGEAGAVKVTVAPSEGTVGDP